MSMFFIHMGRIGAINSTLLKITPTQPPTIQWQDRAVTPADKTHCFKLDKSCWLDFFCGKTSELATSKIPTPAMQSR